MDNAIVEVMTGTNKVTKKEWRGLRIIIGDWSTLIFTKSKFEMDYIEKYIKELSDV